MKYITLAVIVLGILGGIKLNSWYIEASQPIVIVQEQTIELIEVPEEIEWTEERIKEEIRTTFPEMPETFVRIADCESDFLPTAYNPTNNSHDGGIFQISKKYHGKELEALGLDPYDIEDNLKYARLLYEKNGTRDWNASKHCWNK